MKASVVDKISQFILKATLAAAANDWEDLTALQIFVWEWMTITPADGFRFAQQKGRGPLHPSWYKDTK